MTNKHPAIGDYVLATKYRDGDPGDQFAVGLYAGSNDRSGSVRHFVTDNDGRQFRMNGFRRVEKISHERGRWLISQFTKIEQSGRSLWWWKRRRMSTTGQDGEG